MSFRPERRRDAQGRDCEAKAEQRATKADRWYLTIVRAYLKPGIGEATPLDALTTEGIDTFREQLLAEGQLSRRSVQRVLVLLHGPSSERSEKSGSRLRSEPE